MINGIVALFRSIFSGIRVARSRIPTSVNLPALMVFLPALVVGICWALFTMGSNCFISILVMIINRYFIYC